MERPDFLNFLPSYSHSHHRYYHCHSNIIINPINIYNTLLDHVFHVVTHQYSKTMNVDMYMYRPSNLEQNILCCKNVISRICNRTYSTCYLVSVHNHQQFPVGEVQASVRLRSISFSHSMLECQHYFSMPSCMGCEKSRVCTKRNIHRCSWQHKEVLLTSVVVIDETNEAQLRLDM